MRAAALARCALSLGLPALLILAGCVHPAESETLLAPEGPGPDLNAYILKAYQADVDFAFQRAELRGYGTFSRMRLELRVDSNGRVVAARPAIRENWVGRVLSILRPRMEAWRLPKTGAPYTQTVELIRSPESLRDRKRTMKIRM